MNTLAKKPLTAKLSPSPRALALKVLSAVILQRRSLTDALAMHLSVPRTENAFSKQLSFGTLRFFERLDWQLQQLLSKPLKEDQQTIRVVLLLGLYQLQFSHVPPHAAVSETVELLREVKQEWGIGLVNAVLRNILRQQSVLDKRMELVNVARYSHPDWFIKALKVAWPRSWPNILEAGLTQAPLTLRVNIKRQARDVYLNELTALGIEAEATLHSAAGIRLVKGMSVDAIPGFVEGNVSVQDEAAQLAAYLLDLSKGQRVLDACAAPGGKSCHLLELADIELTALEVDGKRCQLIQQNLDRLHLTANIIKADATELNTWWDKKPFDRILLDAPCSATGIIRRQPDIKLHRQPTDIEHLSVTQAYLLHALWKTLKPGGILVYATCSILPGENHGLIKRFLEECPDARLIPIEINDLRKEHKQVGLAILPGTDGMDGFFYAKLQKV